MYVLGLEHQLGGPRRIEVTKCNWVNISTEDNDQGRKEHGKMTFSPSTRSSFLGPQERRDALKRAAGQGL